MEYTFSSLLLGVGWTIMIVAHFRILFRAFQDGVLWASIVFFVPWGELAYWARAPRQIAPWIYAQIFGAMLMIPFYAGKPLPYENNKSTLSQRVDVQQSDLEKNQAFTTDVDKAEEMAIKDSMLREREELNRTEYEVAVGWFGLLKQHRTLGPMKGEAGMKDYEDEVAAYDLLLKHAKREKEEIQQAWNSMGTGR